MRIVEKDFIMTPSTYGTFDLILLKKVKDEETGQVKLKPLKTFYGCTLYSCIKKIMNLRLNTKFESENMYLLDALKELISLEKEFLKTLKELEIEAFDTGE